MNIDDIFSSFPSGISAERPYHFSTIQTIDYYFRFLKYQFSVVADLATIFRTSQQYEKFTRHGALSGRSLEGSLSLEIALYFSLEVKVSHLV